MCEPVYPLVESHLPLCVKTGSSFVQVDDNQAIVHLEFPSQPRTHHSVTSPFYKFLALVYPSRFSSPLLDAPRYTWPTRAEYESLVDMMYARADHPDAPAEAWPSWVASHLNPAERDLIHVYLREAPINDMVAFEQWNQQHAHILHHLHRIYHQRLKSANPDSTDHGHKMDTRREQALTERESKVADREQRVAIREAAFKVDKSQTHQDLESQVAA